MFTITCHTGALQAVVAVLEGNGIPYNVPGAGPGVDGRYRVQTHGSIDRAGLQAALRSYGPNLDARIL